MVSFRNFLSNERSQTWESLYSLGTAHWILKAEAVEKLYYVYIKIVNIWIITLVLLYRNLRLLSPLLNKATWVHTSHHKLTTFATHFQYFQCSCVVYSYTFILTSSDYFTACVIKWNTE